MTIRRPPKTPKPPQGFGTMPPARLLDVTKRGGQASQRRDPETGEIVGKGHRWTKETAKLAAAKATAGRAAAKARRILHPDEEDES
jgi:hypothetical protein